MSYLGKFAARVGLTGSKNKKKYKVDEATSNTSLSNLRYVVTEKPKWKVFRKRELVPIPAYQTSCKAAKGCPCGSNGPCKQKVTPKGVTIHYPQKKKKSTFPSFGAKKNVDQKPNRGFYNNASLKGGAKVKTVKLKHFPTWRLDKITTYIPSYNRPLGTKIIRPRPYQLSGKV